MGTVGMSLSVWIFIQPSAVSSAVPTHIFNDGKSHENFHYSIGSYNRFLPSGNKQPSVSMCLYICYLGGILVRTIYIYIWEDIAMLCL